MIPANQHAAVVDLFCGVGGLSFGLKQAGLKPVLGVDIESACKYPFEQNTGGKFLQQDVTTLSASQVTDAFADSPVRVLAGCAPCQPFSTYSQSRKSADDRWDLLRPFARLVDETKPDFVTAENVARILQNPIWDEFVRALDSIGYKSKYEIVSCDEYGLPQRRKRVVLIASRVVEVMNVTAYAQKSRSTVEGAIGHLPKIAAGDSNQQDTLHIASSLSAVNRQRIKASVPGGTWRDWPEDLRAACHKKTSGATYPAVYGRMEWTKPSPTITTQCFAYGSGRFGHPVQDRAISLREAAILQGFPDDYAFAETAKAVSFRKIGMLIGNAVPPTLGRLVGNAINKSAESALD